MGRSLKDKNSSRTRFVALNARERLTIFFGCPFQVFHRLSNFRNHTENIDGDGRRKSEAQGNYGVWVFFGVPFEASLFRRPFLKPMSDDLGKVQRTFNGLRMSPRASVSTRASYDSVSPSIGYVSHLLKLVQNLVFVCDSSHNAPEALH